MFHEDIGKGAGQTAIHKRHTFIQTSVMWTEQWGERAAGEGSPERLIDSWGERKTDISTKRERIDTQTEIIVG